MAKRPDDTITEKPKKEFDEVMLEVRRVTRVTTGGRQLSFRAIILVGNRKGKIGVGVSKGSDVAIAVKKATTDAYKNVVDTPITENHSVPYAVTRKYKSALIKLIPASSGTGLKAWSSVRTVLDLAWYSNILSKIVGTNNKLNNAIATVMALGAYKVGRNAKILKKIVSETTHEPEPVESVT
jgi:small subunit ribosomal protein S5